MKIELNNNEIYDFAVEIKEILMNVPLFYVAEVLEEAMHLRKDIGNISDLDITSEEEDVN